MMSKLILVDMQGSLVCGTYPVPLLAGAQHAGASRYHISFRKREEYVASVAF